MQEAKERLFWFFLLFLGAIALLIGLYARFTSLGIWSLANDEYHTAQSIRYILNTGLPSFDCGGYYLRGVLFQYLNAAVLKISNFSPEVTMRVVTVATSLLALPAVFLLARKYGGRQVAILCSVLFFLSVWEIEVARYVRMYAPFQSIFIWYIYFFFQYIDTQKDKYFYFLLTLSLFSLFVYEAGIFLVLLNFLALILWRGYRLPTTIFTNSIIMVFAVWYLKTDFRSMGVDRFPTDVVLSSSKGLPIPIEVPKILLTNMPFGSFWFIGFCTILLLSAASTFIITRNRETHVFCRLLIIAAILCCIINLFLFAAALAVICILLNWCRIRDFYSDRLILFSVTFFLFFIFWFAYGYFTNDWYHFFDDTAQKPLKKLLVVLTKYPDIHFKVIHQWLAAMPSTTILLALVISAGTLEALNKGFEERKYYLISIALIIILSLWIAILRQPYDSSRYSFFLYPLIIFVFTMGLHNLISRLALNSKTFATTILALLYIGIADDYSFKHIFNIHTAEYNFRNVYDKERGGQLFYRMDFKTPAIWVNDHKNKNDIVMSTVLGVHFYLDRLDYMYVDYRNPEFKAVSTCQGKKEIWTNANLIYKEDTLLNFLKAPPQTLWLISRSQNFEYLPDIEKKLEQQYKSAKVYTSIDKDYNVYKIEAKR